MIESIILAGFGGQGVMFLGKVLAYSGMLSGLEVCWLPSYGPEMRGGTANCTVLLSDREIFSPVAAKASAGIVLNQPSYDKFMPRIKPGGTLVVNSSIVELGEARTDIAIRQLPAGDIANELGNMALVNMVCLGALLPKLELIDYAAVEKALAAIAGAKKADLLQLNLAAVERGFGI